MSCSTLGLVISVNIYLLVLAYVKILPKIDVIYKENHREVILWYNGKKNERLWVHLFNI